MNAGITSQAAKALNRKSKSFQADLTVGEEQWHTPYYIIEALGPFDLDPCAPPADQRPWEIAPLAFTAEQDGLKQIWPAEACAFTNPPYGEKTGPFMDKAASHPGGAVALVFSRTDTKWCQAHVFGKATAILFLAGRIRFCRDDGTAAGSAGAPSMLVAYGAKAARRLEAAVKAKTLKGSLVYLRPTETVAHVGTSSANDEMQKAA